MPAESLVAMDLLPEFGDHLLELVFCSLAPSPSPFPFQHPPSSEPGVIRDPAGEEGPCLQRFGCPVDPCRVVLPDHLVAVQLPHCWHHMGGHHVGVRQAIDTFFLLVPEGDT